MSFDEPRDLDDRAPDWQDLAHHAARRSGVSVEEWLQSAVRRSAVADSAFAPERPRPSPASRGYEGDPPALDIQAGMRAISGRIEAINRQLDEIAERRLPPGGAPAPQPAGDLAAMLGDIQGRLDALSASTALPPHLSQPAATAAPPPRKPEPATRHASAATSKPRRKRPSDFDLEQAMAQIAERQRVLDSADETAPAASPPAAAAGVPLRGLHDQLQRLTDEIEALRQPGGFEQTVRSLREELAHIAEQLAEAAPRRALQSLEAEVRALAERLDRTREQTDDTRGLDRIERGLDELRDTLGQFSPAEHLQGVRAEVAALGRRIDSILATSGDRSEAAQALHPIEQAVAQLRDVASQAASGEALTALAEEVQAIGEKVDRFVAAAPAREQQALSLLDQRFQELAEHLDARSRDEGANAAAMPAHLAAMVEDLAHKLDRVELGSRSAPLLDSVAAQISRLTEHVQSTEARLGSFEEFEHTALHLLRSLEEMRERVLTGDAGRSGGGGGSFDSDILRQQFERLQQSQDEADRRTQNNLEVVHDTLERLVDRLAVVEKDLRSGATPPRVDAPSIRPPEPAATAAERQGGARTAAPLAAAPSRAPLDPSLPADHPLEPGSARAPVAPPSGPLTAAERIAASEAALGPAKPVVEGEAKLNFIAAARRAAQAAANMSEPAAQQEDGRKRGSSFGALAQKLTGRRTLMLGLILLLGAGTLHVVLNGVGWPRADADAPRPRASVATPAQGQRTAVTPAAPASTSPAPAIQAAAPEAPAAATPASPAASEPARPAIDSRVTPTVSPLTIASLAIPAGNDLTGSLGRSGAAARSAAPGELPTSIGNGLRSAALGGDPAAEYEIATRFAEGRGVTLNLEEAARWFERAANRDLAPAQYRLGSLYEKGHGVKKDLDQARRLYRAAADKGHAKAMHNLAVLYAEGIGGKPDFRAAAEWFRRAAQHGVADSQYNLGILCARGLGAEQSLAESYQWFALAALQGDQDAAKKRDDVAARLDAQALAQARAAVQGFKPQPQPEAAVTVATPAGGWDAAASAPPASTPAKPLKIKHRARPS